MKRPDRAEYIAHFQRRVVQDAIAEALPSYWERRAETFANVGTANCDEIARACLNAAAFYRMYPLFSEVDLEVSKDVA